MSSCSVPTAHLSPSGSAPPGPNVTFMVTPKVGGPFSHSGPRVAGQQGEIWPNWENPVKLG
jgi:hypothetical protein